MTLQSAGAAVDADADAHTASLEIVLQATLVGRGEAARVDALVVLLEEGVDDLLGRVAAHVLVEEMNDEETVRLEVLVHES